jgi:hypothetical protein
MNYKKISTLLLASTISMASYSAGFERDYFIDTRTENHKSEFGTDIKNVQHYVIDKEKREELRELYKFDEKIKAMEESYMDVIFPIDLHDTYEGLTEYLGGEDNFMINEDFKAAYDIYAEALKIPEQQIMADDYFKHRTERSTNQMLEKKAEMEKMQRLSVEIIKPFTDLTVESERLEKELAKLEKENEVLNNELKEYVYSKVGEDSKIKEKHIIKPKLSHKKCKETGYVTKEKKKDGKYFIQLDNDYCMEVIFVKKIKKPLSYEIVNDEKFKSLIERQADFAMENYQELGIWKLRKEDKEKKLSKRLVLEKESAQSNYYKLEKKFGVSPRSIDYHLKRTKEMYEEKYNIYRGVLEESKKNHTYEDFLSPTKETNEMFAKKLREALRVTFWLRVQDIRVDKEQEYYLHKLERDSEVYTLISWEESNGKKTNITTSLFSRKFEEHYDRSGSSKRNEEGVTEHTYKIPTNWNEDKLQEYQNIYNQQEIGVYKKESSDDIRKIRADTFYYRIRDILHCSFRDRQSFLTYQRAKIDKGSAWEDFYQKENLEIFNRIHEAPRKENKELVTEYKNRFEYYKSL